MEKIRFLDEDGTFELKDPELVSGLYFPLAGEAGLKSAVTPCFGGDCKLDQESFLLEPVSVEDLHNSRSTRNFWCCTEDGAWSATGVSARQEAERFTGRRDESTLTAGLMWQTVCRKSKRLGLAAEITAFVPVQENTEVLCVRITNTGSRERALRCIAAVPLYGRSADNIRDHRNVTSMLHRIRTTRYGVEVTPTMSFDEKGHRPNRRTYYALGVTGQGGAPVSFYPTVQSWVGEGGSFLNPRALAEGTGGAGPDTAVDGQEAMGGIAFAPVTLKAGESAEYLLFFGICEEGDSRERLISAYGTWAKAQQALADTKRYWQGKVNVRYHTGSPDLDRLLRWVSFQPMLRRLYGCSFLPHHDYGRGGRGWRDLWQDCLSLLLLDPDDVGAMIRANFGGVRIDGTNATIIGAGDGNFIADRNGIARVWMDHSLWPLMTTKLYIDQTGDLDILLAQAPYFKDSQAMRGTRQDEAWRESDGSQLRTQDGGIYTGSILEHLLVEHLTAYYEVGAHNIFRLRGADWNDALDMAAENGESVAFTCAYAGNLRDLAALLRALAGRGYQSAPLLEELQQLLTPQADACTAPEEKNALLMQYAGRCRHTVSGKTVPVPLAELADRLGGMAQRMMEHIRRQEWIDAGNGEGWFNSYYDDHGRAVEGVTENGVRMMLTGQVFATMSGTATDGQVRAITRSADHYLYRKEQGGYRLNTDFHELKFDMGRMFGFAYGEKENGAVFSHMAVMYANALYRRGFVRAGYKALQSLADAALDFETSRIYPGIPEYFNAQGRGVYHYLTGAASWYMLTMITEVFGVRGEMGDLVIRPKLVREQFDENGRASIELPFAGKRFLVTLNDLSGTVQDGTCVEKAYLVHSNRAQMQRLPIENGRAILRRSEIEALPRDGNQIMIELM